MTGKEKEVGEAWDALDIPGKKALMDGGAEAIKFSAADNAKVRQIGAEVSEAKIKELEGKGLPARAVYNMMRSFPRSTRRPPRIFGIEEAPAIARRGYAYESSAGGGRGVRRPRRGGGLTPALR